jgi:transcriptional regulator with XRE-family HTH domain
MQHKSIILEIGLKIRKIRQERELTVQQLAERADVSKGLISRIENGRTIPSLPVLIAIVKGLNVEINHFFGDIDTRIGPDFMLVKNGEGEVFQKENVQGYLYRRILTQELGDCILETTILEIEPGAKRHKVTTDAYELKYMLEGSIRYIIGQEEMMVEPGDVLYFDGRIPHVPLNTGSVTAKMLVIYLHHPEER